MCFVGMHVYVCIWESKFSLLDKIHMQMCIENNDLQLKKEMNTWLTSHPG